MTEDCDEEHEVARHIWHGHGPAIGQLAPSDPRKWAGSVQAQFLAFGAAPDLSPQRARHAPAPDVAAITLIKDEADIIGLNLEWLHHLGVRRFVILDNASTDGTVAAIILFARRHRADTEVELLPDTMVAYIQAEKMNFACQHASERWPDLAWLLPFDADEFLQARTGLQELLRVPSQIDALTLLRVIHFRPAGLPDPDSMGRNALAAMSVRSGPFAVPPKVILRARPFLSLEHGNHAVRSSSTNAVCYGGGLAFGLFIREFQTRSFVQFRNKVRNGGAAIRAAHALGSQIGGQHWLAWEAILQNGGNPALHEEYCKVAYRELGEHYVEDRFDVSRCHEGG